MPAKSIKTAMLAIAIIAAGTFSSCKKEKSTEPDCSVTTAHVSGTYKLISLKYKATATAPEQDFLALMNSCEKDDLVVLADNGTYTYKDEGSICSPSGNDSGTWSLSGNTLTSDGIFNGTITSFDCSKLSFFTSGLYVSGDKLEFVMQKQ